MTDIAFRAMMFARAAHKGQVRKYSGNPYHDHLAEVAGITATVLGHDPEAIAVAWLHDTIEDCGVTYLQVAEEFNWRIADGVLMLSDLEEGNRKERKHASCLRLEKAEPWLQTIKCADLISNTSSILAHDQKFARTYLTEKSTLLTYLYNADTSLRRMAWEICQQGMAILDAQN